MDIREIMRERTLVLIKPDSVVRDLAGQILSYFAHKGLKMIGLKMLQPTPAMVEKHLPTDKEWLAGLGKRSLEAYEAMGADPVMMFASRDPVEIGRRIRMWNVEFLLKGPVIVAVYEGPHVIEVVRKIIGHTLPLEAAPGTVRGDFSAVTADIANFVGGAVNNMVHASSSPEEAQKEVRVWFCPEELVDYSLVEFDAVFFMGTVLGRMQGAPDTAADGRRVDP